MCMMRLFKKWEYIMMPNNFDIREVHSYSKQMFEIVETLKRKYINKNTEESTIRVVRAAGHWSIKNISSTHPNLIFKISTISQYTFNGWHSKVQHGLWDYKLEYFNNHGDMCNEVAHFAGTDPQSQTLERNAYWREEDLQDEGLLFQNSLVLDEQALFGICCTSWLYRMGLRGVYIICEYDVDTMKRVHAEICK